MRNNRIKKRDIKNIFQKEVFEIKIYKNILLLLVNRYLRKQSKVSAHVDYLIHHRSSFIPSLLFYSSTNFQEGMSLERSNNLSLRPESKYYSCTNNGRI